jgi:hypothetical protein
MVLISARDEPAERWCVANNAVRHADATVILFFLIRFNASHIVFLKYPSEEVFEGNK